MKKAHFRLALEHEHFDRDEGPYNVPNGSLTPLAQPCFLQTFAFSTHGWELSKQL